MKPLSERDENAMLIPPLNYQIYHRVGMKPLSERDENTRRSLILVTVQLFVGMKPLSERDENSTR